MPIQESREISEYTPPPALDLPSARRFREKAQSPASDASTPPDLSRLLTWTVPAGWSKPSTPDQSMGMRTVDLRFGPQQEGECYISLLPGPAGGLEANINRWRSQMGQPPLTPEQIANLPRKPFFNRKATFVDVEGDFKAFGADAAKAGYRLLGLIDSTAQATIFVKLTGPKVLVEQNTAAFEAFCQSIRPNLPPE
ncbi:MAG: hypothetical protein RLZZ244_2869 [Verrucomicrobiota bacterium]|jgi:hypothetical protein